MQKDFPEGLYLLSDDAMLRERRFLAFLEEALDAGLKLIQLRSKELDEAGLEKVGRQIRDLTRRSGATFIVNDSPELALRLDADGVHLGQDDASPERAREVLGAEKIVGLSTHSKDQIQDAASRPVDYIGFGPVFQTRTKADASAVVGTDLLKWAVANTDLPLVAIGGIALWNLDLVLRAGVSRVAIISEVSRSADPLAATREFMRRLGENKS
jgi:thiamine-phosphate pyrophosphorylase